MHAKYQEKLKQINDQAKLDRANLKAFAKAFPNIWSIAEALKDENPIIAETLVSDYWGGTFLINVRNLNGFKGEDFVNLLFAIEQTFGGEFTMVDHLEYNEKVFSFNVPWTQGKDPKSLTVKVEAQLKTDSTDCRRVVVGETIATVRRPIYKLICSDDEAAAVPAE